MTIEFPHDSAPRAFEFSTAEFDALSRVLHDWAGIRLSRSKQGGVYARVKPRLAALGLGSFAEYCALVASDAGQAERSALMGVLGLLDTGFFRHPQQFEHLRRRLAPLADRARRGGRVRLWSAGCATGEEAYSLGLALLSFGADLPERDVRILATDIDPAILRHAEAGIYDGDAALAVPEALRPPHTRPDGALHMPEELRRIIAFRALNLRDGWPFRGGFDIIFCRGVICHFDLATREEVLQRLALRLVPDGVLYLGPGARLSGAASRLLQPSGAAAFVRRG